MSAFQQGTFQQALGVLRDAGSLRICDREASTQGAHLALREKQPRRAVEQMGKRTSPSLQMIRPDSRNASAQARKSRRTVGAVRSADGDARHVRSEWPSHRVGCQGIRPFRNEQFNGRQHRRLVASQPERRDGAMKRRDAAL